MNFGAPLEIRVLVPEKGHGASQLYVWEDILFSSILSQEYKLSFSGIGSIAIKISAPGNPPFSLSSFISPANKSDLTRVINSSMSEVNDNEARNKPSNPLVGFEFDKIINPVTIVHIAQTFVFH